MALLLPLMCCFFILNIGLVSANNGNLVVLMTPKKDVFVWLGKSFDINCTVMQQYHLHNGSSVNLPYSTTIQGNQIVPVSENDLIPTSNNIVLWHGEKIIPAHQLIYFEDELTVQYKKEKSSFSDNGAYFCFYMNGSVQAAFSLKTVQVGVPPGKPSVACLSNSFLDMVCYVTLNETEGNIPFRWQMEFKTSSTIDDDPVDVVCNATEIKDGVLKFVLPDPWNNFKIYTEYSVTANGTSINDSYRGFITSTTKVITDFSIVKPARVNKLHSSRISSTTAFVEWSYPDNLMSKSEYSILQFEVLLTEEHGWDKRELALLHDPNKNPDSVLLEDLVCNTNYSVAVRSRPDSAVGEMYWSEWRNITFRTLKDVPSQSTVLPWGSFYILEDKENSNVSVVIYWKNPAVQYQCGPIEGYEVTLAQINSGMLTMEMIDTSTLRYETREPRSLVQNEMVEVLSGFRWYSPLSISLSNQEQYLLKMFTSNQNGTSFVSSELMLPNQSKAKYARVDLVTVEMHDGRALVSWEMDEELCSQGMKVTYFWCSSDQDKNMSSSYALCKDGFNWKTVSVDKSCTGRQWLDITEDMSNLRFAVAVKVNNVTGGMKWDKFSFKAYDAVPSSPQYQVSPIQDDDTKVKVTLLYNNVYNLEEGGRPDKLELTYMESEEPQECHKGSSLKYRVNLKYPVIMVENLNPDTSYVVCGRFINQHGKGRFGEPQIVKTSGTEGRTVWVWVVSAIGICTVIVVFFVFLIWGVRRAKNRIAQKTKVDVPNIGVHTFPNHQFQNNQTMTKMNENTKFDNDSGRGTATPPSSSNSSSQQSSNEDGSPDHEGTQILRHSELECERGVYELGSNGSVLSGYMDVSEYRSSNMEEDLLSITNEESGETNNSFMIDDNSHVDETKFGADRSIDNQLRVFNLGNGKLSILDQSEVDLIDGDDDKYKNEEGSKIANNISCMLDGFQMTSIQHKTDYVAHKADVLTFHYDQKENKGNGLDDKAVNKGNPHTDQHKTEAASTAYRHSVDQDDTCSKNDPEQATHDPAKMAYTSVTSSADIKPNLKSSSLHNQTSDVKPIVIDTGKTDSLDSVNQMEGSEIRSDTDITVSGDVNDDTNEKHIGIQEKLVEPSGIDSEAIYPTKSNTDSAVNNGTEPSCNISQIDNDKTNTIYDEPNFIASENLEEASENLANLNETADNQIGHTDDILPIAASDDDATDIFSDRFDDLMMESDFDCYQNPDLLSLGQGSIVSDGSEEVGSIRTFTSEGRDTLAKEKALNGTEADVVNLCNKINTEFVVEADKLDEGDKTEHIISIPDEVKEKHKTNTVDTVRDSRSVNSNTSVEGSGNRSCSGGSGGEINSYVRAWNKV